MTRRPFDPRELDETNASGDHTITELERYAMTSDTDAPDGLSDRIMAAVEHEPAPRRGIFAALASLASAGGGAGRFLRVGAMAATLVLAVAGALFAGQLADLVRDVGGSPSPTPSVLPSPSQVPSTTGIPSLTDAASPSPTPEASDDHGGSGGATAQPTPQHTANATPEEAEGETKTPRPSASATASPGSAPTQTP